MFLLSETGDFQLNPTFVCDGLCLSPYLRIVPMPARPPCSMANWIALFEKGDQGGDLPLL
jgi:hypothetical protein